MTDRKTVRAAGGIARRFAQDGSLEVLVVHRPKHDDWSFPKGKADDGESDEDCAVREVEEETGLRCRLTKELPTTSYVDRLGRPKVVRYWILEVVSGTFVVNDEVDDFRWVSVDDAVELLSYDRDKELVATLRAASLN